MMMSFEPLYLLVNVPGEVAGTIAGAGGVAIAAMWRRIVTLEGQAREDFRAGTDAMREQTRAVERLAEKVHDLTDRLTG